VPAEQEAEPIARPLSAEDRAILAMENPLVAGHTCKLVLVDGDIDADRLRSAIAARLARAPDLSLRLAEVDGAPWWVPEPDLDLSAHVVAADFDGPDLDGAGTDGQAAGLPAKGGQANGEAADGHQARLRAVVAALFAQRLDRSRPLWRIDVIGGLPGGGTAPAWRVHHALADGSSVMRMAGAVLWDEEPAPPDSRAGGRKARHAWPGASDGGQRLGDLLTAAREAPRPWLHSPFDGRIDALRSVAFATAGLADLRSAARVVDGATVNDAVLTVVAGGLRRWLETRHGHLGAIRVKVPVSLHGLPHDQHDNGNGAEPGNRDSFFCLDLPLATADPVGRLATIRHATRIRKQDHDAQHLDALMRHLARTPRLARFAEHVLSHPRSFALNVSNVPGPRRAVRVLSAPVTGLYALAEIGEQHALRIAVVSLAGTLYFGFVADPTLLPDVDHLAADVQAEAAALIALRPAEIASS
jgi:diacylglycerol O-acyltransferase / wax synthase